MVGRGISRAHRPVSRHPAGQTKAQARRSGATVALVQTFSKGIFYMANDTHSVGFCAGEILDQTAARQPQKTAIITKEEELTFATLNRRVHALAGHLQNEGVKQGERVGVLLPNCAAIPLSYFATQKIGAVTGILDARLKGKELQGVLKDADLKLLIVHNQLHHEVEEVSQGMPAIPAWVVNGERDRAFEKRFSAPAGAVSPPSLKADDDALIL